MPTDHRAELARIKRFDQLVRYLRDDMGWPIANGEDFEDLTFEYTPEELGIDAKNAAKIQEIKRLRPLTPRQPWGIFFVKFEPKRLPVVALRRILGQVALKKRASANKSERQAWAADDLLFVSNYGEGDERRISFAHFSKAADGADLPTLKVLGWDNLDTPLHLDNVAETLTRDLAWPEDSNDEASWRERWRAAFTLRHREVITTSKQLSERLAELARAIRDRIRSALTIESERGPLTQLMKAFQTALVHDLDNAGFADMYAQTIAYGLLSARITDPSKRTADDFAAHMRTNPFLKELMETFLHLGGRRGKAGGPGIDFDELGVSEVVELLDRANMEAVVRDFGDRNPQEDPVIHFYEHFLTAYDKKQKVSRGVFYTPRPVVSYIVRSVDELLRTEFGLADGLADTTTWGEMAKQQQDFEVPGGTSPDQAFVQILDPATGTGTFLVEVIDLIHKTMVAKWKREGDGEKKIQALWNEYVPKYLLPRLHGYELLMAPYAIAHLKIGLKLYETGYRFESDERARVYLTNALEPESSKQLALDFLPALAHEAATVNEIKRKQRFTVVIGNPPYAGHSRNNQVEWIVDKVYDYKRDYADLQKPGQAKWLQDDYVKFLRLAEWETARSTSGILGFITNHAWLDNPTFKGMRKHFLDTFDWRCILDLHGNTNRKEMAPDGGPDKNVFEIRQGVAISILARRPASISDGHYRVRRSDLLGTYELKVDALLVNTCYSLASETFIAFAPEHIFARRNEERKAEYDLFPSVPSLFNQNGDPAPGIVTTHDEFAVSFTRREQVAKVEALLATGTEGEARELFRLCSQSQWSYQRAKQELPESEWRERLVRLLYRPFDTRWTVFDPNVAVHRRERVTRHMLGGKNIALIFMRQVALDDRYSHFGVSRFIVDNRAFYSNKGIMFLAPLYLEGAAGGSLLSGTKGRRKPNLDPELTSEIAERLGLKYLEQSSGDFRKTLGADDFFHYVYAVFHSPGYRNRYADLLKIDFPRLPLTDNLELYRTLAKLGSELVALHLMESSKQEDLASTYFGRKNPEVRRVGWSDGTVWLDATKTNAREGHRATKPGTIGFRDVAEEVWDFHVGGYQVCHKWLKDRKGRTLTGDDIAHYQKIVVALSETIRIMAEIDEAIEAHGSWPDAFQLGAKPAEEKPAFLRVAESSPPYDGGKGR